MTTYLPTDVREIMRACDERERQRRARLSEWLRHRYEPPLEDLGGSFAGDTPILTPEGLRSIRDAEPGTSVVGFHTDRAVAVESVVRARRVRPNRPIYRFHLDDGFIFRVALAHRLLTRRGWVPAAEIQRADDLLGHDGRWFRLLDVRPEPKPQAVHNLLVDGCCTFIVGPGLVASSFCELRRLRVAINATIARLTGPPRQRTTKAPVPA